MPHSEILAAAAHLHVLLRRKTGRVTDTEWMASDPTYARAMIAFARQCAADDGHEDLLPLAARVETLMHLADEPEEAPTVNPVAAQVASAAMAVASRYVGRLR